MTVSGSAAVVAPPELELSVPEEVLLLLPEALVLYPGGGQVLLLQVEGEAGGAVPVLRGGHQQAVAGQVRADAAVREAGATHPVTRR